MTSLGGGGAEKVLMTILKNFDYQKYDVTLCLISRSGIYLNELPEALKTIYVYLNPMSFIARLGFVFYSKLNCSLIEKLTTRFKIKGKFDTIVSFCEGRSLKFHGYLCYKSQRNLTWVHCDLYNHHHTIGPVLSQKDEKRLYEIMDEVVFVSKEAETNFMKLDYKLKKSCVIHNPIDYESIIKYRNI